jgi:drug/metabolite transporter (DMT)-like permease
MTRSETRGHLALSGVALIYGANYVIAKSVMPDPIGPNSFIVLRVVGAAFLFWLILRGKFALPHKKDWLRISLCAVFGVATNQLFFFNGLALTSSVNASIVMTSNPILVMLFSMWLMGQRFTLLRLTGILLGAAGAIGIILFTPHGPQTQSSTQGDLFILINSASWAMYLVLVRPLMDKYHPMMITAWVFSLGILLVLPFGGTGIQSIPWSELSSWQWFGVFYVVVCVTFLTYLLNMYGIYHLSPNIASTYIYLQPLLAGLFAWLFSKIWDQDYLGQIGWVQIIGGAMIFLGIYLVSLKKKDS